MTTKELDELGLTLDQYAAYFDDEVELEDEAELDDDMSLDIDSDFEEDTEDEVEASEEVEEPEEESEPVTPEPEEEEDEEDEPEDALNFKNLKAAAIYLADTLNLKVTNTLDCLYKCLKASSKTHGYFVVRHEDSTVTLTLLKK